MNPMNPMADIFERLRNGETISFDDSEYHKLRDASFATRKLLLQLNQSADPEEMRGLLSKRTMGVSDFGCAMAI